MYSSEQKENLRKNVPYYFKKSGLSLSEFQKASQIDSALANNYIQGVWAPKEERIDLVSKCLSVSVDDLLAMPFKPQQEVSQAPLPDIKSYQSAPKNASQKSCHSSTEDSEVDKEFVFFNGRLTHHSIVAQINKIRDFERRIKEELSDLLSTSISGTYSKDTHENLTMTIVISLKWETIKEGIYAGRIDFDTKQSKVFRIESSDLRVLTEETREELLVQSKAGCLKFTELIKNYIVEK